MALGTEQPAWLFAFGALDTLPDRPLRILDQRAELVEVQPFACGGGLSDHAVDLLASMVLPQVIHVLDVADGCGWHVVVLSNANLWASPNPGMALLEPNRIQSKPSRGLPKHC